MEISLTAAGLLADIIGVAFIGFAFLRSDAQALLEQAKTKWDYSPEKARHLAGLLSWPQSVQYFPVTSYTDFRRRYS